MSMITEEFGVIPPDIQTQMLIAPVMGEMIATRAFAIGEQFIVNSTLYKATKAIAIGDTISVGTSANDNCILSDTIAQQIKELHSNNAPSKSFDNVWARKDDGIVTMGFQGSSITNPDGITLGVIDDEYRPASALYCCTKVYNGSSYVDGMIHIVPSNGSVVLVTPTYLAITGAQPKYIRQTITYKSAT